MSVPRRAHPHFLCPASHSVKTLDHIQRAYSMYRTPHSACNTSVPHIASCIRDVSTGHLVAIRGSLPILRSWHLIPSSDPHVRREKAPFQPDLVAAKPISGPDIRAANA
eukprot:2189479-Rhodomonas_salina.1